MNVNKSRRLLSGSSMLFGSVATCLVFSNLSLPAFAAGAAKNLGGHASKKGFSILYNFSTIGGHPYDAVLSKRGIIYGAALNGGANGDGAVYQVAADGTEATLYNFTGSTDGAHPYALQNLVMDKNGNLYGTTESGGQNGSGVVFEISPSGTETVLHAFSAATDGGSPYGGVVMGRKGVLYGTTSTGGANGGGTVYELTAAGVYTVLWSFGASGDGSEPEESLTLDNAGDIFGTTVHGGAAGFGTVFELPSGGSETVLYSFAGGTADGSFPSGALVADASGDLYGVTASGGLSGGGTIFEITPAGGETVLFSLNGVENGSDPRGVVMDSSGNLYGTAEHGGANNQGTIFELAPDGTESTLHTFTGGASDGAAPYSTVTINKSATHIYGTTTSGGSTGCGGSGCGTLFELSR